MRNAYPREDDKPWYQQFWPWFVISLPAIAVVAGLATVMIAMKHKPQVIPHDDAFSGPARHAPMKEKPPTP